VRTPEYVVKDIYESVRREVLKNAGKRLRLLEEVVLCLLSYLLKYYYIVLAASILARTIVAGVMFTTPSEEIPRQLINKCNYKVNVRSPGLHEPDSESAIWTLKVVAKLKLERSGVAVARGY
jgi:hypothetical protein